MPVFGHKQLSLIIVFILSLPFLLESQQMNMLYPSQLLDLSGFCGQVSRGEGGERLGGFHLNVSLGLIQTLCDGRINPRSQGFQWPLIRDYTGWWQTFLGQ